jgi:hypothetical protein
MKLKGLVIAVAVAPIIAYFACQVPWWLFSFGLDQYIGTASLSDVTTGIFFLTWLGIAYAGLRSGRSVKKKAKRKKSQLGLDKEFTINDVKDTFKPSIKNALLEFIIIGNGKNLHQIMPYTKEALYKAGNVEYKVENSNLLVKKPFLGKLKLTAIFHEGGVPVKVEESKNPITAEILYLAQRSGALERSIKEMFSSHLNMKKILFIVGAVAVAGVVFFLMSGGFF